MNSKENPGFSVGEFLASAGLGRRIVQLKPEHVFFAQGTVADSIFYLQKGRPKLTVVSRRRTLQWSRQ